LPQSLDTQDHVQRVPKGIWVCTWSEVEFVLFSTMPTWISRRNYCRYIDALGLWPTEVWRHSAVSLKSSHRVTWCRRVVLGTLVFCAPIFSLVRGGWAWCERTDRRFRRFIAELFG